jgi:hypothetical protein
MAGQGRPLALSDRYPDATRLAETRKSFETSAEPGRFGTEGSEVQILSPRPINPQETGRPWQQGLFPIRLTLSGRAGECCEMSGAFVPVTS